MPGFGGGVIVGEQATHGIFGGFTTTLTTRYTIGDGCTVVFDTSAHEDFQFRPYEVLKMVMRRAGAVIGIGLTAGLGGALALTRVLESSLYGITPTDPPTYAVVCLVLTLVALAACVIPTRKAVGVDPTVALRHQ